MTREHAEDLAKALNAAVIFPFSSRGNGRRFAPINDCFLLPADNDSEFGLKITFRLKDDVLFPEWTVVENAALPSGQG